MRVWIVISLFACAAPPRPPPKLPADPNAVNGCRSSPTVGGTRYTCTSHEVFDTVMDATSIRAIEKELVTRAREKGIESTTRTLEVDKAEDAVIVEYRAPNLHAFDLVAMTPLDTKVRVFQCTVQPFESASSAPTLEATCKRTIGLLLARPAPVEREVNTECKRATNHLATLPGHPPERSDELHAGMRDFALRCTDKIATCALAAKAYVEATLCD